MLNLEKLFLDDHSLLSNLSSDDHTQYALLAGRAGGQTLIGGTASGEDLTLQSTAHATKGHIIASESILVPNGTSSKPAVGFSSETNTGMYISAGVQKWVKAGVEIFSVGNNGLYISKSGSASLPALRLNDGNTGFFFKGSDTFALSAGGVETMTIAPNEVLVTGNNASSALVVNQKSTGNILELQDNGTAVLTVADGGNVGIGTTGPGSRLTVLGGSIVLRESDDGNNAITLDSNTSEGALRVLRNGVRIIQLHGGASSDSYFNIGGNFGIGTTSPSTKLHVIENAATTAAIINQQSTGDIFELQDNGTTVMTIADGGDMWFETEGSGIPFGGMYINIADDFTVTIADANPTEVQNATDVFLATDLNLVTFTNHHLDITKAGKYEIIWSMSVHTLTGGKTEVHGGVMIDGVAIRDNGEAHRTVSNTNDTGAYSGVAIVDLPNGNEELSLWVINDLGNDIHVNHANVTLKQLGGT